MDNVKVLLADDHEMIRQGLRTLLLNRPGTEIVAEAKDGRLAVRLAKQFSPDIVIMDINMPDLNGIDATRQIKNDGKDTKVIALSGHTDRRFTSEMMNAGASGYVVKESAFEELAQATSAVVHDKIYISPRVTEPGRTLDPNLLTARERQVLELTAQGMSMKEVAARLKVSVKTIETHRKHLMEKLDLHSVAELTKYALREGMTALNN
jgi:two-component system response regulator NreC